MTEPFVDEPLGAVCRNRYDRPMVSERPRSYEAMAWGYEEIARLYSLGRIARAKAWQVTRMAPGERVLYLGIGRGEDALLAARLGARVTGVDLSPAMLARLRRRLAREGLEAELIRGDLFDHGPSRPYDVVAANFVLNVFSEPVMRRALAHAAALVRPGGRLMLADFALPVRGWLDRCLCNAHYRPVNWAAWCLGLCSLHPIYDYACHLAGLGFELAERRRFALGSRGPALYETLIAVRVA